MIIGWGQNLRRTGAGRSRTHSSWGRSPERAGAPLRRLSPAIFGADGVVFFNGESVRIRRVIGMDWAAEGGRIKGLQFICGEPRRNDDPGGR